MTMTYQRLLSKDLIQWYRCWKSKPLTTRCTEPTHWKRPWWEERLRARGERGDTGWDGWMSSPTQWTRVWANCKRWWKTRKPDVLESMGSQNQTQLSDWMTIQEHSRLERGHRCTAKRIQVRHVHYLFALCSFSIVIFKYQGHSDWW